MPTLEILQLQTRPGVDTAEPSILKNMVAVRTALREKVHNTNSRCYQVIDDPSLIFIFGSWPDLATHARFTNSAEKDEVLAVQGDQTSFNWMIHTEIDDINKLPFDAKVMVIQRWGVKGGDHVTQFSEILAKYASIMKASSPWEARAAWRTDSEDGTHEYVMLSGWDGIESHKIFENKIEAEIPGFMTMVHCEWSDMKFARNMEA